MNVHRIIEEALEGNDDITLPNQADQEFCSDDGVMKLASALNFIGNNLENAVPSQEEILAQAELLSSLEKEAGMSDYRGAVSRAADKLHTKILTRPGLLRTKDALADMASRTGGKAMAQDVAGATALAGTAYAAGKLGKKLLGKKKQQKKEAEATESTQDALIAASTLAGGIGAHKGRKKLREAGFTEKEINNIMTRKGGAVRGAAKSVGYSLLGDYLGQGVAALSKGKINPNTAEAVGGTLGAAVGGLRGYQGETAKARRAIKDRKALIKRLGLNKEAKLKEMGMRALQFAKQNPEATGAAAGATIGAGIGAARAEKGKRLKGALVGGTVGAGTGAAVGHGGRKIMQGLEATPDVVGIKGGQKLTADDMKGMTRSAKRRAKRRLKQQQSKTSSAKPMGVGELFGYGLGNMGLGYSAIGAGAVGSHKAIKEMREAGMSDEEISKVLSRKGGAFRGVLRSGALGFLADQAGRAVAPKLGLNPDRTGLQAGMAGQALGAVSGYMNERKRGRRAIAKHKQQQQSKTSSANTHADIRDLLSAQRAAGSLSFLSGGLGAHHAKKEMREAGMSEEEIEATLSRLGGAVRGGLRSNAYGLMGAYGAQALGGLVGVNPNKAALKGGLAGQLFGNYRAYTQERKKGRKAIAKHKKRMSDKYDVPASFETYADNPIYKLPDEKTASLQKVAEDRINPAKISAGPADPYSGEIMPNPGKVSNEFIGNTRDHHALIALKAQKVRDRINKDMKQYVSNVGDGYNLKGHLSKMNK